MFFQSVFSCFDVSDNSDKYSIREDGRHVRGVWPCKSWMWHVTDDLA